MENIKIFDNFLTQEELIKFYEKIHNSNFDYKFMSNGIEKFDNMIFGTSDLCYFFNKFITEKIESVVLMKFELLRNYTHLLTYGAYGSYHTDDKRDDTYTFCIYITDISDSDMENANGDFLLKIPNTNFIVCINTLNNRGILFPSTYYHKGMAYNRFYNNRRFCFTWKLKEIRIIK